jgi:uncharacterized membrane protein
MLRLLPKVGPDGPRLDPLGVTEIPKRPTQEPAAVPQAPELHQRVLTALAAIGLMGAAFATWSTSVQLPLTGLVAVLGFIVAMTIVALAATTRSARHLAYLDVAVLGMAALILIGWAFSTLYFQPGYGTDEAAFTQFAAHLMVHGHDPYGANLLPALTEFRVPIQYATYTLSGHVVSTYGYPALPILFTSVFLPITHGVQTAIVAEVVALLAGMMIMFFLLPRSWRALAPLSVVGLPLLFGYSVSGVTAILMATLLIVVANRWSSTGSNGRLGASGLLRAGCLGLAIATQQLAWFIAPFVVIGIFLARRHEIGSRAAAKLAGRFVAVAFLVFSAVNAPFVIWNPSAWLHGILAPLTQNAIPYGQGLIDASLFFHRGGGDLSLYTYAGAALYLLLLCAFVFRFDRLGRAAFILPSIAFFLPTRSLAEYFMTLPAVWIVSIVTTHSDDFERTGLTRRFALSLRGSGRSLRRLLAIGLIATLATVTAAMAIGALSIPPPFKMKILSVETNGQLEGVWQLKVGLTNQSSHKLTPHFATNTVGQATTYWNVVKGPTSLAPHASAIYSLIAPNRGSMPGITTPFLLDAYTDDPSTVTASKLYTPEPYSTALSPSYVDQVLHPGQATVVQVELRSPFGASIAKANVRVALGQIIYGQNSLIPSEAIINSEPVGQTPVTAMTNSQGVATFRLVDHEPQGQPIYFQAWVDPKGSFPYGYSDIVSIFWKG